MAHLPSPAGNFPLPAAVVLTNGGRRCAEWQISKYRNAVFIMRKSHKSSNSSSKYLLYQQPPSSWRRGYYDRENMVVLVQNNNKCHSMAYQWRWRMEPLNTFRPRQNGCYFPDDIFECIFLKENVWIPIKISLKFVPKGPINNIPALVQIMAWRRPGDKQLSEPMLVRLPTYMRHSASMN